MNPHDVLISKAIQFLNYLEQYIEEFDPPHADEAMEAMENLGIAIHNFIDEE
jgi:hypothetical protein